MGKPGAQKQMDYLEAKKGKRSRYLEKRALKVVSATFSLVCFIV